MTELHSPNVVAGGLGPDMRAAMGTRDDDVNSIAKGSSREFLGDLDSHGFARGGVPDEYDFAAGQASNAGAAVGYARNLNDRIHGHFLVRRRAGREPRTSRPRA